MATKLAQSVVANLAVALLLAGCGGQGDSSKSPQGRATRRSTGDSHVIRIGLVPEKNIYRLRDSYRKLADYLSQELGETVEVATLNTYESVLLDFQEKQVDAAFLGSLVAVLAMDRYGARVLMRPEQPDGESTYCGLIIVRQDSPIHAFEQLKGKSLAVVKTTYAGAMFPLAEMVRRNMYQRPDSPKLVPAGTHDEAIDWVVEGRVDAAAIKDLRLAPYRARNPAAKLRVLTDVHCKSVPNNALVIRKDVADTLGPRLVAALQKMEKDPDANAALEALGATKFIACDAREYEPIIEMVRGLNGAWKDVGAEGPAPTTLPIGGR